MRKQSSLFGTRYRMTQSTQTLPDNYQPVYIINLAKNKVISSCAQPGCPCCGIAFLLAAGNLHQMDTSRSFKNIN